MNLKSPLFNLLFENVPNEQRRFRVSAEKLLLLHFVWIPVYLTFANFLERNLLPLRLLCYTQGSNLDSLRGWSSISPDVCIEKMFGSSFLQKPSEECPITRPVYLAKPQLVSSLQRVLIIRTAPNSFDYRTFVRESWASKVKQQAELAIIFSIGRPESVGHSIQLTDEASIYRDILLVDSVDSYRTLSLKMIRTFDYLLESLPKLRQIVVVNDDTIVNATSLKEMLWKHDRLLEDNYVVGKVSIGYPRLFFPHLPWFVSSREFPHKCYPPFVQGSSFIISSTAARLIGDQFCRFPFIPLDDVMLGVMYSCLGRIQIRHEFGFDRHLLDNFVVFHYQWSRFSSKKLRRKWEQAKRMNIFDEKL